MPNLQKKQASVEVAPKSGNDRRVSGAFVPVPVELLRSDSLSSVSLKLYLILLSYCGPKTIAWPSQGRLAQDMHLSERRVRRLLVELVEAKLVEVKHCNGSSNTYTLRKYSLREVEQIEAATKPISPAEENFRGERKKISDHVHEAESKNMCEEKAQKTENKVDRTYPLEAGNSNKELQPLIDIFVFDGISAEMGLELARLVVKNGRGADYVKLISEASHKPQVHNPIGFIRFMVLRNVEPDFSNRFKPQKRPTKSPLNNSAKPGAIDFEKYTSGKYAYLSANSANQSLEAEPPAYGNEEVGHCEALENQPKLVGNAADALEAASLIEGRPPAEDHFDQSDNVQVCTIIPTELENEPLVTSLAGRKTSLQDQHMALRIAMANFLGIENSRVIAEWEAILSRLGNESKPAYFSPALGFRFDTGKEEVFKVVFRNNFDMRTALRHKHLLEKCLAMDVNCPPEIIFQSLDNLAAAHPTSWLDLEAC